MFKMHQIVKLRKSEATAEIIKVSKTLVTFRLLADFEVYNAGELLTINKKYIYQFMERANEN